jgi:Aspartyl protease/PDZ domain
MNRRQALFAATGAVCLPAASAAEGASLEWLRTADIGGWPLLRAVAGGREGSWIVDTGASQHAVDSAWAAPMALQRLGDTGLTTITGARTVRQLALPALHAGPLEWPAMPALEVDLSAYQALTGVALAGILGMPLFAGGPLLLDLAAGRLQPGRGISLAAAAPLTLDLGLPVVQLSLGARAPEPFLLDTGNPGAVVVFAHRAAELLAQRALPRLKVREPGGSIEVAYALLDTLRFAGQHLEQVPLVLEAGASARRGEHFDRLSGSLGMALFEGGAIALDPAGGSLRATFATDPLPGGFGFTLRADSSGPLVQAVVDGGPAARAAVTPADRLVAIDGAAASELHPAEVWTRLRPLTRVVLGWQRSGRVRDTPLARERFFPRLG